MYKTATWIFISMFSVYLLTANGRIDSGDGLLIFNVSRSMLENQNVTIPEPDPDRMIYDAQARPIGKAREFDLGQSQGLGRDGKYYAVTGIGHSLLILPLLALGQWIAQITSFGHPLWLMQFVTAMLFNPIITALTGTLVYLVAQRLSFSNRTSLLLVALFAVGTMAWVYAKSSFSDPLISLLLFFVFYSLLSFGNTKKQLWLWWGGAAFGYALLTKTYALTTAPVFVCYLLYIIKNESNRYGVKALMAFLMPIGIGVVGVVAYNWVRFGVLLDSSYRGETWTVPFFTGIYGLIASPGKSYFLYNPIMFAAVVGLVPFYRRYKPEFLVIVSLGVIHLLVLARYDHWHGGGGWGPRLLLHLTPFLILPLGALLETIPKKNRVFNFLLAILIAASVLVQIAGVSVGFGRYLGRIYDQSVELYNHRVLFEARYSPLIGQWLMLQEVVSNVRNPASRMAISQLAQHNETDLLDQDDMALISGNVPDFWFINIYFIDFSK